MGTGRFLVRLSELVRVPRGLPGPGFGLPWAAGGQGGWPSRWGHFSGPGGRTAARVPFPRVRSRPLCRGVAKSGPHDLGGFLRRNFVRAPGPCGPVRWKKKVEGYRSTCRDTAHLIRRISRTKWAISWSRAASPLPRETTAGIRALGHFMGSVFGKQLARYQPRPRCPGS